jgi:hypothetical protein
MSIKEQLSARALLLISLPEVVKKRTGVSCMRLSLYAAICVTELATAPLTLPCPLLHQPFQASHVIKTQAWVLWV